MSNQVMVWKTNFDRFMENYSVPVAVRSSVSSPAPSADPSPPLDMQLHQHATGASSSGFANISQEPLSSAAAAKVSSTAKSASSSAPQQQLQQQQTQNPRRQPIEITNVKPHFDDYEVEVPPPLNLSDLPESLSATLQVWLGEVWVFNS